MKKEKNHMNNRILFMKILHICMWLMLVGITVLSVIRCFYGIEKTDEAYYVAEAVTALHGNYPFAYNFSHAAGMVLVTAPLVGIYEFFVPTLAGVFLYLRICFVFFRLAIIILSYFILKKTMNKTLVLMEMLFLMPCYYKIQQFSYNTISSWLTIFTGILLYGATTSNDKRLKKIYACIAGLTGALSVLAHPLSAMGIVLFGILLIVFDYRNKSTFICYAVSGIVTTVIILVIIGGMAGFEELAYGMNCYLKRGTSVGRTSNEKWGLIWKRYGKIWITTISCAALTFICSFLFHIFKHEKKIREDILNSVLFSSLVLSLYYFTTSGLKNNAALLTMGAVFLLMVLFMFPVAWRDKFYWFMSFPPILFCLMEVAMTKNSGPEARFYFIFASFVGLLPVLYQNIGSLKKGVLMLLVLCLMGAQVQINRTLVYRDAPMEELVYQIKEGTFKGIYTKEQNAMDMLELEAYIHEVTTEDEWVKFLDNVPVGYLFSDGKICDVRTWDEMNYTYDRNNPTKMYKYFINRRAIPDKLIYVDYGRDEQLSIEDEHWKFNEFVSDFYEFGEERILNETFRVKIYLKKPGVVFADYLTWVEIKLE